jgi:hypothetical protein
MSSYSRRIRGQGRCSFQVETGMMNDLTTCPFYMNLYFKMVEKMFEGDKGIVSLLDVIEIECEIE